MSVTFAQVPRTNTPLILGLAGPSSSGKTGSALELAHGFQEVQGGDIGMLDSEAGRGNHYQGQPFFSDKTKNFKYKYAEFGAPFSPAKYTENIAAAVKQGIKHLIIDSQSHMHESPGGILEWHDQEVERMTRAACARWNKTYNGPDEKYNLPAWAAPKQAVGLYRAFFTQQKINIIFCFRAKPKMDVKTGKSQGFQPIITEDIVFEMITRLLLYPGAKGVPTYEAVEQDEKKIINVPEYFQPIFADQKRALSAWHGKQMARWAQGTKSEPAAQTQPQAQPSITSTPPKAAPADGDHL